MIQGKGAPKFTLTGKGELENPFNLDPNPKIKSVCLAISGVADLKAHWICYVLDTQLRSINGSD